MIKIFILTIVLRLPNGNLYEMPPVEYKSMSACLDDAKSTYATPMGKYRLISAKCRASK